MSYDHLIAKNNFYPLPSRKKKNNKIKYNC